jgi:hypothetical protein
MVGTKVDLAYQRQVTFEEAASFAASIGASYLEVSSALNTNVADLFEHIVNQLVDTMTSLDDQADES